jgi:hypothetical protein
VDSTAELGLRLCNDEIKTQGANLFMLFNIDEFKIERQVGNMALN